MASTGIEVPSRIGHVSPNYENEKPQYDDKEARTELDNVEAGSLKISYDSTHRQLRPRHIQLIGIGGTIGTALYVSIGHGLINGGPGSLFLAFTIWYVLTAMKC